MNVILKCERSKTILSLDFVWGGVVMLCLACFPLDKIYLFAFLFLISFFILSHIQPQFKYIRGMIFFFLLPKYSSVGSSSF